VNGSEINRLRFAIVRVDNCDSGVAQRSVDGEHAHLRKLKIAQRVFNLESWHVCVWQAFSANGAYRSGAWGNAPG